MTKFDIVNFVPYLLIWFASISVLAIILTVYDKIAATKRPKHRTPEATLLLVGILGGALFMYITMNIIRHKTQHKKFMIGLPIIIVLQIALILLWALCI